MKKKRILFCFIAVIIFCLALFVWFNREKEPQINYNDFLKQKIKSQKERQKFFNEISPHLNKKPSQSVLILEYFLKQSLREKQILEAKHWEKELANLAFYQLKNYTKAIRYYSQLLTRPLDPGEKFFFQYQIAQSFFYLKKAGQALLEVEKCFFKGISEEEEKQALFLKIQILVFQKNFVSAEAILKEKITASANSREFLREYLAFVYESQNKFLLAIEELKKIKNPSPFLKSQIKRLEKRRGNQPGGF